MIGTNVARRYAKALFEIGHESQGLSTLVEQISTVAKAYEGSLDLQKALDNPLVAPEAKKAILTEVADRSGVAPMVKHTLLLLNDRRRLHALPAIAQLLREMSDAKQGILRAEVTTAVALSDGYYAKLARADDRPEGRHRQEARPVDSRWGHRPHWRPRVRRLAAFQAHRARPRADAQLTPFSLPRRRHRFARFR